MAADAILQGTPMPSSPSQPNATGRAARAIAVQDWPKAEAELRRLVKAKDAPAQAAYNLALVLIEGGKAQQAGAWFAKAVRREPTYAAAWFEYGRWHLSRGDLAKAGDAFEAVTRLEPEAEDGWRNLGRIRERLGEYEASLTAWEAVAGLADGDGEAALGMLRALLELRRPEAARLRARLAEQPALRPGLLKVLTRTSAGTLSLNPARLAGAGSPTD